MFKGELKVPGDKSITHRALIFSAFVDGAVQIDNVSTAADCNSTAQCMRSLGLGIDERKNDCGTSTFLVESSGIKGLKAPASVLDCGNSGTTIRILSGLVSGLPFESCLDGDQSIRKRTMSRIIKPLEKMGAKIETQVPGFAPLKINGGGLVGQKFELNVSSAQVQTCLLLAGLQAENGETVVSTPDLVRDHTLRMFSHLQIPFVQKGPNKYGVKKLNSSLPSTSIEVPADISSAAFFMVGAALSEGSDLVLQMVGLNPGRTMIVKALKMMGADIEIFNQNVVSGEPVGDIRVKSSKNLNAINLGGKDMPSGIDEIPILALGACFIEGETVFSGLEELRHKESDRLALIVNNLSRNGADVKESNDGISIKGKASIKGGADWYTKGDHRMAMTGKIASVLFENPVDIDDESCVAVSYPEFHKDLKNVLA